VIWSPDPEVGIVTTLLILTLSSLVQLL